MTPAACRVQGGAPRLPRPLQKARRGVSSNQDAENVSGGESAKRDGQRRPQQRGSDHGAAEGQHMPKGRGREGPRPRTGVMPGAMQGRQQQGSQGGTPTRFQLQPTSPFMPSTGRGRRRSHLSPFGHGPSLALLLPRFSAVGLPHPASALESRPSRRPMRLWVHAPPPALLSPPLPPLSLFFFPRRAQFSSSQAAARSRQQSSAPSQPAQQPGPAGVAALQHVAWLRHRPPRCLPAPPRACRAAAMPSIGFYRNYGKTFKKPRRPFEKERLDAELKVVGEFGLRNKRELWRVQMVLSKLRARARDLLTLDEKDPK